MSAPTQFAPIYTFVIKLQDFVRFYAYRTMRLYLFFYLIILEFATAIRRQICDHTEEQQSTGVVPFGCVALETRQLRMISVIALRGAVLSLTHANCDSF